MPISLSILKKLIRTVAIATMPKSDGVRIRANTAVIRILITT